MSAEPTNFEKECILIQEGHLRHEDLAGLDPVAYAIRITTWWLWRGGPERALSRELRQALTEERVEKILG